MTSRVVVVGGGVAGLATALALARGGLPVDVLERDRAAAPFGRRSAASWTRDGTPQAQHSHVFGPACHHLLRTALPDVLALLLDAGARERVPTGAGADGGTGLALRRPLLDWVLRRTAERQPGVRVHSGVPVTGVRDDGDGSVAVAVRGGVLTADLVLDATGRNRIPGGAAPADGTVLPGGAAISGGAAILGGAVISSATAVTTYYSRSYALRWPEDPGPLDLGLAAGGDFDGYTCRAVPGDSRTVTVTFGVPHEPWSGPEAADAAAVAALTVLRSPTCFQAAAEAVPGVADWVEPGAADPLGGVSVLTVWPSGPARRTSAAAARLVAVGDARGCVGSLHEQGVGRALAHSLVCAAAVLAAGDGGPADLGSRIDSAWCAEVPMTAVPRRAPGGPDAEMLAVIAESARLRARISV